MRSDALIAIAMARWRRECAFVVRLFAVIALDTKSRNPSIQFFLFGYCLALYGSDVVSNFIQSQNTNIGRICNREIVATLPCWLWGLSYFRGDANLMFLLRNFKYPIYIHNIITLSFRHCNNLMIVFLFIKS